MYAVIASGGKQYRVGKGDVVRLEKIHGDVGAKVEFGDVLLLGTGKDIKIGHPLVEGAKVKGEIIGQNRGKKLIIFKMRRRKGYRRKTGHRQQYTDVRVTSIEA